MRRLLYGTVMVAAMALAARSQAQTVDPTTLNICSGGPSGNYYWAAKEIGKRINFLKVNIVNTDGSLANLRNLANGKCDIGFAQSDVVGQYMVENPSSRDNFGLLSVVYTEYAHILCPTASGWTSLTDMAKASGQRAMIVGGDGTGTAETWRILRQVDDKLYGGIQRDPSPADYASAHDVANGSTTCMLWVSGLNSNDMASTNVLSAAKGKPSLLLVDIDDPRFLAVKGLDGKPLYVTKTITPKAPTGSTPALYDHLINNGGVFSSAGIKVLAVPANMMISLKYKEAIGRGKLTQILEAIDDAKPTIWAKVDPADAN